MLWIRLFLPFSGAYFLSYHFRTANAVIGPVLSQELSLGAADLGLQVRARLLQRLEGRALGAGVGVLAAG